MLTLRWKDYPLSRCRGEEPAHYAMADGYLYIRIPLEQMLPKVDSLVNQLPTPRMTKREQEVYSRVLEAKANKQIASELNLSERTVKFHVSQLLAKFSVGSRLELYRAVTNAENIKTMPLAVAMN